MSSNDKPFRLMKSGYDRFEVDQAIEALKDKQKMTERQLDIALRSEKQLQQQYHRLKEKHDELEAELLLRERAADKMVQQAMKDANTLVQSAQENADSIVREALMNARVILVEIKRIAQESREVREELRQKTYQLTEIIDTMDIPDLPKLDWDQLD